MEAIEVLMIIIQVFSIGLSIYLWINPRTK